jgi:Argonaute linker 1 domain
VAGRNFYSPSSHNPIAGGAEVWLGYYQSLRLSQVISIVSCEYTEVAAYHCTVSLYVQHIEAVYFDANVHALSILSNVRATSSHAMMRH